MGKIKAGKFVVGKHEASMWLGDDAHLGNISLGSDQLITATTGRFESTVTVTVGSQNAAVARTATVGGVGTGTIADGTSHKTVTSGDANHIITLPTPTIGNIVSLSEDGTTGYELRTHNPASCSINRISGSGFETAIAGADTLVECVAIPSSSLGALSDNTEGSNLTDGQWICSEWDADGDMTSTPTAD